MKGKKTHPSGRAWWREYRMTCLVLAAAVAVFIAARLIAVPAASGNSEPEEYAEYENGVITQILADNTVTDPTSDGAARGEQLLLVDVKTGQYAGETLQVYNYVGPLYGGTLKEGQGVTLIISTYSGGTHTATVFEYNRTLPLIVIVGLFLLATVLVGGKVGAKSLVGLAVTLACLFWILIPLLMKGAPTLLTTLLVCAYITVVTLTILGGFRRKTVCAMVGTLAGVALAMAFGLAAQALLQVDGLRLSDVEPLLQLRQTGTPIGLRGLLVPGAFAGQHAGQKGVKTEKRFKGRVFIGIPGIARLKLRIMRAHGEPGGVGGKELHQGVLIQQEFGRVDRPQRARAHAGHGVEQRKVQKRLCILQRADAAGGLDFHIHADMLLE